MCSAPARSAIVRATFSTRWYARADSPSCWTAARKSASPAPPSPHHARTSFTPISAFDRRRDPANRAHCRDRAASTRARTVSVYG
jgi:hypothetical protein